MSRMHDAAYRPRLLDRELQKTLEFMPAVTIEGPRGCGKTTTGEQAAASFLSMDEVELADASAGALRAMLDRDSPLLIDEWQVAPAIWNAVRRECDRRGGAPGQFILTGSSTLPDNPIRHSGAGRMKRLRLRTFSSHESGLSNGAVSLGALLQGETVDAAADLAPSRLELAEAICRGGWPASLHLTSEQAVAYAVAYADAMCGIDIRRSLDTPPYQSTETARRVLRSLARNIGTTASVSTLARDTTTSEQPTPLDRKTLPAFLEAFEKVYLQEDCTPWGFQPASKQVMRTTPKRFLADPSLAPAALGVDPRRLAKEPVFMGNAFESLVMRDLRAYADANDAEVRFYKESSFEVDAVVENRDGAWVAVEVKLSSSGNALQEATRALQLLARRAEEAKKGPPSKLVVVVGVSGPGEHTALRIAHEKDGIAVVPVATLGP